MCNFKLKNTVSTIDDYRERAKHVNNCIDCGTRWIDDIEVTARLRQPRILYLGYKFDMDYISLKDVSLTQPREFMVKRKGINTEEVDDVFLINHDKAFSMMNGKRSSYVEKAIKKIKGKLWKQVIEAWKIGKESNKKMLSMGITLHQAGTTHKREATKEFKIKLTN